MSNDQTGHIVRALARIEAALATLTKGQATMALDLTAITAAINAEDVSIDNLVSALTQQSASLADIKAQLAAALAAGLDPAAVQAIIDNVTAEQAKVDAAVASAQPSGSSSGSPAPSARRV